MNLGLVRAATISALPMCLFSKRTGTATFFKCMPIRVKEKENQEETNDG